MIALRTGKSCRSDGTVSVSDLSYTLNDLLMDYSMSRDISKGYLSSLTRTVKRATNAGLRYVHQIDDVQVNRFLASLSTSVSKTTQANIRREFLTLWNYAVQENLTDTVPLRVRKIRVIQRPVEAWSHEELQAMLAVATNDETNCGGIAQPKLNTWMPHWITIGYETALRFSDIYNLRQSNIRRGSVCCTANKTGKPLVRPLTQQALQYANELIKASTDGSLFSWMLTRRRAFVSWKNFLERHQFRGSSKWLRRSCATYLELNQPGSATKYLQHTSPTLAIKHYIDQSLGSLPEGPPSIK